MNQNWTDVCDLHEIVPDTGVCALVRGEQVALFRPAGDDQVYALGNYDPIGGANVLARGLIAQVGARLTVASPLYKQHFCLHSGQCLERDDVAVPVYPVRLSNGRLAVGPARRAERRDDAA
ncbi:MAG: nitrite reductase small subunit NirD [Alcanivorax sp.]|nr:nitrite reductase small subunit NirD [Alcanivorax sp.]